MPGGEGEPAVAAGSPFSGPCAAADAGGPFAGRGALAIQLSPAHRCTLGLAALLSALPFWRPLVGRFFLFDAGWGGCKNAGCPLVGRWVDCARSSGGRGKQRISARGGCACRAGRGYLLRPAGRGVARRARRRRGAPGLPNKRRGFAHGGEEASACCARQGEGLPAVHGGGEARPVCPTGGRGTVAHGREKRHPRAVPGRERGCPPCTAEEKRARFANRGEGAVAHGREKRYPRAHEGERGARHTRQGEKSARRFRRGERWLRGRREADRARQGAEGQDTRRTGRGEGQLRLAEGGGPAAPGKGEKGAGRNRQQKESDFVYFVKAFS